MSKESKAKFKDLSEEAIKEADERVSSLRARPGQQAVPEIIEKQLADLRSQREGENRNRSKQD